MHTIKLSLAETKNDKLNDIRKELGYVSKAAMLRDVINQFIERHEVNKTKKQFKVHINEGQHKLKLEDVEHKKHGK